MNNVCVRAPAKINLGLRVLKKRPDGYHEIETVFQMVSLFDDLRIEEGGPGIRIESDRDDLPCGEGNLIYRAAELLGRESGRPPAVRIRLCKRIPIAAGLGGGSSDAAATLVGLNRLWNLGFSRGRLMALAGEIGMDVPFFLFSATAFAKGRGEILEKLPSPSPPLWILLIHPGFKVSTAWAYQSLKLGLTIEHKNISIPKFFVAFPGEGRIPLENDLEKVTFKEYPRLKEIKGTLETSGALHVLMSGSGSAIFGLFQDKDKALSVQKRLEQRKDLSVYLVHTLSALPA
ncbi:MAG: 4-(cytidine 5'-diphospho)-2-C-methyl-D-erythritol kinase [bacterium]